MQDRQRGRRRAGGCAFIEITPRQRRGVALSGLLGLAPMMRPPSSHASTATLARCRGGWMTCSWTNRNVRRREHNPRTAPGFARQRQTMWVFAELVRDTDRNKGNVVSPRTGGSSCSTSPGRFACRRAEGTGDVEWLRPGSVDALRALTEPALKEAVEYHLTAQRWPACWRGEICWWPTSNVLSPSAAEPPCSTDDGVSGRAATALTVVALAISSADP